MLRVAVIDDGISHATYKRGCHSLSLTSKKIVIENKFHTETSHGDIICNTILNNVSNCEIYSVKIKKDHRTSVSIANLYIALCWCIQAKIDVINVSLGSTSVYDIKILKKILYLLKKNNIFLVSAMSNDGLVTYPASLDGVIGVKGVDCEEGDIFFEHHPLDGGNISGYSKQVFFENQYLSCNSFFTPEVTSSLCNYIKRNGTKKIKISDFYEETFIQMKLEPNVIHFQRTEVPLIQIINVEKKSCKGTIINLFNRFYELGYNVVQFYEGETSIDYHMVYFDKNNIDIDKVVKIYQADLAILFAEKTTFSNKIEVDMTIMLNTKHHAIETNGNYYSYKNRKELMLILSNVIIEYFQTSG